MQTLRPRLVRTLTGAMITLAGLDFSCVSGRLLTVTVNGSTAP